MRIFRRKENGGGGTAVAERTRPEFSGTDAELRAEIDRLRARNAERANLGTQRQLLELRNVLGLRRLEAADGEPAHPEPDTAALPSGETLPEIAADALTPGLIRAGILRDGCLLVRGLFPRQASLDFADLIDRSFDARERSEAGKRHDASLFEEYPHYGDELARPWIKEGGGVLAVDSPGLAARMFDLFDQARLPELVQGYLGEPPLITAQKTTLRKAAPSVPGSWHQDGKFMGNVRALNLWLSLSRCGDLAPGLDIVPRRLESHVVTQTDEAVLGYSVSQRVAEEAAGEKPILRPIFEPGDALLFDDLFLHKTGSDPSMPNPRYAIECWFFGGSAFPADYGPIAV